MKKRLFSLILTLVLVLGMLSMAAMADERQQLPEIDREDVESWLEDIFGPDWSIMPEDPEWPEKPVLPIIIPIGGNPDLNTTDHVAYLVGFEDGTFRPNATMTRAEAVTIFFRLLTTDSRRAFLSDEQPFLDVNKGDWYYTAVATMYHAGVVVDSKYDFRPNDPITRAELAVMAAQFCDYEMWGGESFTDVPDYHWAAEEITVAERMGWLKGYPDGTFRPDAKITRAEVVAVVNRMLGRAVHADGMLPGMETFRDNSRSAWYYADIQEAANSHTYLRTEEQVAGQEYSYETWYELEENPDWTAMESICG